MSWLWGNSSGETPDKTPYDPVSGSTADPYAMAGRQQDIAKVSDENDGVQDMVGGIAISNNKGGVTAPGFSPYGDLSGISVGDVAPMFGQNGGVEYLDGYNKNGRDVFQRMVYNMGHSYLGGIALGGLYGAVEGLRNSPSNKMKIRLNSFLNAAGKRGSRAGNACAVIAMLFSLAESTIEYSELEKYTGRDTSEVVYPVLAGATTGFLFKSTSGNPRIMALYTILGGGAIAGIVGAARVAGEQQLFL
jgi:import inner membrane translocase subunit TIM23